MSIVNKEQAEQCASKAASAFERGDFATSLRLFDKALRLYPDLGANVLALRKRAHEAVHGTASQKASGSSSSTQQSKAKQTASSTSNASSGTSSPHVSDSPPTRNYTPEQAAFAKKIMNAKDYYEVLGVNRDCSEDDVRRAYKKLALKLHPDKNSAPEAAPAFQRVAKGYETLSDPDKKAHYDRFGEEGERGYSNISRGYAQHGGGVQFSEGISPEDLFNMMFGGGFGGGFGHMGGTTFQFGGRNVRMRRPAQQQRTRHNVRQEEAQESGSGLMQFLQLIPFFLFLIFTFFNFGGRSSSTDRVFSLERNSHYTTPRNFQFGSNPEHFVPYYVRQDLAGRLNRDSVLRERVEEEVQDEVYNMFKKNCEVETTKYNILRTKAARLNHESNEYKRLQKEMETMPKASCDKLNILLRTMNAKSKRSGW